MAAHLQFRLDDEAVSLLDEIVAEHEKEGRIVSRHSVARMLLRTALEQPKKRALAYEMIQLTWYIQDAIIKRLESDVPRLLQSIT